MMNLQNRIKKLEATMLPNPQVLRRYEMVGREIGETDESFHARCEEVHEKGFSVIALIPGSPKPPIPPPPDLGGPGGS